LHGLRHAGASGYSQPASQEWFDSIGVPFPPFTSDEVPVRAVRSRSVSFATSSLLALGFLFCLDSILPVMDGLLAIDSTVN
jgi:hypothetical protein